MKMYEEAQVKLHMFLTLALNGNEWSASHSDYFICKGRALGNHYIGGLVGRKSKASQPPLGIEPVIRPIANNFTKTHYITLLTYNISFEHFYVQFYRYYLIKVLIKFPKFIWVTCCVRYALCPFK